jgi:hypothetical protein
MHPDQDVRICHHRRHIRDAFHPHFIRRRRGW